jgi:hypothetical protein
MAETGAPEIGMIAEVRARRWIVTQVERSTLPASPMDTVSEAPQHLVSLSSVEDDGLGDELDVVWEIECWTSWPFRLKKITG